MTAIDELLARNLAAAEYHPVGMGPMPTLKIALLMCMDARIDGHGAFRLNPGEVHLLRNAGGVVTDDVIRSLAISQHALGTREIMIIHHTDCGLARLEEDDFRAHLATFAGYRPTWSVQAFKDPHDSVRESLRRIRDSPFLLHHDAVRGFIFDVNTGLLEEVFVDGDDPTGQLDAAATPPPPGSARVVAAAVARSPMAEPGTELRHRRSRSPHPSRLGHRREPSPLDADLLIEFFDEHGRDLPWREPAATPWARAGQRGDAAADAGGPGAAGVRRMAAAAGPTPADLAADSPADAIRAWGRLGYPRRALRLHAAATAITVEHGGSVPDSVEDAAGAAGHRRVHRAGGRRVRVRRPDAGGRHQRPPGAVQGGPRRGRAAGAGDRGRPRRDGRAAAGRTGAGRPGSRPR